MDVLVSSTNKEINNKNKLIMDKRQSLELENEALSYKLNKLDERIQKEERVLQKKLQVELHPSDDGVKFLIRTHESDPVQVEKAKAFFYRPNDSKLDQTHPLEILPKEKNLWELNSPALDLKYGQWIIHLEFVSGNDTFLKKFKFFYR